MEQQASPFVPDCTGGEIAQGDAQRTSIAAVWAFEKPYFSLISAAD